MENSTRHGHQGSRRIGVGLAGGVLGAAAIALAGPQTADAAVNQLSATPNINFGSATNYGTGCGGQLQADVTDPVAPVTFYDNGVPIGTANPGGAYALLAWTPGQPGVHHLAAVQAGQAGGKAAGLDLRVGSGLPIGFGCLVGGG
ncbi:MAG: hypothetical protein J2P18_11795 [Nocardia sp.]|nr:hypothetical protein [Nocardia sp.]